MKEIVGAHDEGRLIGAFGCGTAAVVSPIQAIGYDGKVRAHTRHNRTQHATTKCPHCWLMGGGGLWQEISFPLGDSGKAGNLTQHLADTLAAIQYGEVPHDWSIVID
jgi:branched-chain amino acid aminotransferase